MINTMTNNQINLVKKTWMIFQKIDPVLVGDVFYEKLFTDRPSFRLMFKKSKQEQSKKLVEMLNYIVSHLDALDGVGHEIRELAVRHTQYGVEPTHYQSLGTALLWTLQQGLGSDWNEEVKEAWSSCYCMLSDAMIYRTKTL